MFGLNAYEWCGNSVDYMTSGYKHLNEMTQGYPVPIFFSETGCNQPMPRSFADQAAIFGPQMSDTWSGAIIYEWIQEENNYGLIHYGNPSAGQGAFLRSGTPTPVQPDFSNLASQWAAVTPSSIAEAAYSPSLTQRPCPAVTPDTWPVDGNVPLPAIQAAVSSTILSGGIGGVLVTTATVVQATGATSAPATSAPASNRASTSAGSAASAASPSTTAGSGASSGSRELTGMSMGLVSVMLAFVWWL